MGRRGPTEEGRVAGEAGRHGRGAHSVRVSAGAGRALMGQRPCGCVRVKWTARPEPQPPSRQGRHAAQHSTPLDSGTRQKGLRTTLSL